MTWRTGQAYSQDLRDRVLAAVDGGLRVREVAPLFRVSISYIYKALERRAATGETRPCARGGARRAVVLRGHEAALLAHLRAKPGLSAIPCMGRFVIDTFRPSPW